MSNCIYLLWWKEDVASSRVWGNVVFTCKNEIKTRWGDSKNEIGFDVHHIHEHIDVKDWKTRPIMVEKCQNLRKEIKTRWGDSVNLCLYWGHRTNKSRRSYGFVHLAPHFWNNFRGTNISNLGRRNIIFKHFKHTLGGDEDEASTWETWGLEALQLLTWLPPRNRRESDGRRGKEVSVQTTVTMFVLHTIMYHY